MKDKEFELNSEKRSFTNQVANDSKYLNTHTYSDLEWNCIKKLLNTFKADGFITEGETLKILKGKSVVMYTHISELLKLEQCEQELQEELPIGLWKQLNDKPRNYYDSLARFSDNLIKLYLKYKKPIFIEENGVYKISQENRKYNKEFSRKINLLENENKVVYEIVGENTSFSVNLLIELLQDGNGINNTIDYGKPLLYFWGEYFEIGTEFRLKNNTVMTRDTTNFGYEFDRTTKEIIRTINWIDLD